LVKLALLTGEGPVFNTLARGESLNSGSQNLAVEKLETSLYRVVLVYWRTIISFSYTIGAFDRQTDGRTASSLDALNLLTVRVLT